MTILIFPSRNYFSILLVFKNNLLFCSLLFIIYNNLVIIPQQANKCNYLVFFFVNSILFLFFPFLVFSLLAPFHANKTFANKAVYCASGIYNPHKRYKWQMPSPRLFPFRIQGVTLNTKRKPVA